ncbi:MAG: 4Fe-4S dicluster domain-containing protein, partial [Bacteroidales bacterium]|nr:4Fe-4S dicluster domain-containing protein [Bacteroidales bacterium]
MKIVIISIGFLLFLLFLFAAIYSIIEKERRAVLISVLFAILLPAPFLLVGYISFPDKELFSIILIFITCVTVVILFFPSLKKKERSIATAQSRYDERDVIFSRVHYIEGTEKFNDYYSSHPEKKVSDDLFRSKPGLLSKGAAYYEPLTFASALASFFTVNSFTEFIDGDIADKPIGIEPEHITTFIKNRVKKLGAKSCGITLLQTNHLYSHVGRGKNYGMAIEKEHKYAIAFTFEMDKEMMDVAPHGPTTMESADQYLKSGAVATQIASFIRNLGYPARAHIDGNYRVICPLVARDAGLGEIGRMGLLMTPELGPRVRISIVTTDIPLVTDNYKPSISTLDFCEKCKKCAVICPSNSISHNPRGVIEGVKRWQIHAESCYTYWSIVGTDCGRCMSVCPFSHPDNLFHRMIRFGIRISPMFRSFAVKMD